MFRLAHFSEPELKAQLEEQEPEEPWLNDEDTTHVDMDDHEDGESFDETDLIEEQGDEEVEREHEASWSVKVWMR